MFSFAISAAAPLYAQQTKTLDVKSYIAELDRVATAVKQITTPEEGRQLNSTIPAQWDVEQDGARYEVSTGEITDSITALNANPKKARKLRQFLDERLASLRSSAEEMLAAAPKAGDARGRLQQILSRKEFGSVREPTWLDRLKERVLWWIYRTLGRLFNAAGRSPRTGYVLMWGVIIAAFVLLALAAWGWLGRRSEDLGLKLGDAAPPAKRWREWLADARASAKRGDYRNAIRCAYWAAIFRLEESGRWKVNLDLTPREYLRKLAADDHQRPPLSDLTRCFELTWYGYQPATSNEFELVNQQLEKLGCLPPSTVATPGS